MKAIDQHHRRAQQDAQRHHEGELQVVDVVGQPGDQRRGAELVDVGEGELLHLGEQRVAQVGAEAHAADGGQPHDDDAEADGRQGQQHHVEPDPGDVADILVRRCRRRRSWT